MSGTVESPSHRFAKYYKDSYPPQINLKTSYNTKHIATSNHKFRTSRHELMYGMLNGETRHEVMTQGLLAEQMVHLALRPLLQDAGFFPSLAPQSLEHGKGQKGIDMLIRDNRNTPYLGIDVKLRQGQSELGRDGFGWDSKLQTPFVFLSLGNWYPSMRDAEDVTVKDWLSKYSIPGIQRTGKIPRLDELRGYLLGRLERTLNGAHVAIREPEVFPRTCATLPDNIKDLKKMREKVGVMHHLFTALQEAA